MPASTSVDAGIANNHNIIHHNNISSSDNGHTPSNTSEIATTTTTTTTTDATTSTRRSHHWRLQAKGAVGLGGVHQRQQQPQQQEEQQQEKNKDNDNREEADANAQSNGLLPEKREDNEGKETATTHADPNTAAETPSARSSSHLSPLERDAASSAAAPAASNQGAHKQPQQQHQNHNQQTVSDKENKTHAGGRSSGGSNRNNDDSDNDTYASEEEEEEEEEENADANSHEKRSACSGGGGIEDYVYRPHAGGSGSRFDILVSRWGGHGDRTRGKQRGNNNNNNNNSNDERGNNDHGGGSSGGGGASSSLPAGHPNAAGAAAAAAAAEEEEQDLGERCQLTASPPFKRKLPQPFSHMLVCDFEATCEAGAVDYPHEIIEFPVVVLDTATLRVVAQFREYVRPVRNPKLSEFCTQLTGITQAQVDAADPLPVVIARFKAWLRGTVFPLCRRWRRRHGAGGTAAGADELIRNHNLTELGLSRNLRNEQRKFVYDTYSDAEGDDDDERGEATTSGCDKAASATTTASATAAGDAATSNSARPSSSSSSHGTDNTTSPDNSSSGGARPDTAAALATNSAPQQQQHQQQPHKTQREPRELTDAEAEAMLCFATDGPWDMRLFMHECSVLRDGADFPPLFYRYVNVRHAYTELFRCRQVKLTHMLRRLGMTFVGCRHSGLDDTRNILRVLAELMARGYRVHHVSTIKYAHRGDAFLESNRAAQELLAECEAEERLRQQQRQRRADENRKERAAAGGGRGNSSGKKRQQNKKNGNGAQGKGKK